MRKTALHQEALLLGPRFGVRRGRGIFTAQHLGCTSGLAKLEVLPEFRERITFDTMAMQLGKDAIVAVAGSATVHQRFGKSLLGEKAGLFEPVEQCLNVIALLRVRGKLTRKFQATMLT